MYIGHSAKKAGKFNKCLATLLAVFATGMFIIAVAIGLLTAFVSGVCNAVDDAAEQGTCSGPGDCTGKDNAKTSCQLTVHCNWTSEGETNVCGISPLTYICAILDIIAALTCFIFGYSACCCTKDDNQVAAGAPQVVIVQAAQPGAAVVQAVPAAVVVEPKEQVAVVAQ